VTHVKRTSPSLRLHCNFRVSLVVAATVVVGLYKLRVVGWARPLDLFLACTVDALAYAWLLCLTEVGVRLAKPSLGRVLSIAFVPLFYVLFACDLAHATFYDVATERRFSLLDVDPSSVVLLLRDVVTTRWLLTTGALAVAVHTAAWGIASRKAHVPVRASTVGLCVATAATALAAVFAPRVPSPLVDTARDAYDLLTLARVVPKSAMPSAGALAALDKSDAGGDVSRPAFSKILVFVMETVPTRDFESERAVLRPDSFLRALDGHAHRYDRYYATNQDSRTGMLDMLGSRLVPYEAYTEYGLAHYTFLSSKTSLVSTFNRLGYETAYAVSHADREAVLRNMPWRRMLTLPEARVRSYGSKFACVTRYEFEHGCEDLAILPDVLDFVDAHERAFVYQEFIWGHDPEYNEMSGRTNADYYSSYLDKVVEHLRSRGMLDDTLIVVTSDHGYRSRSRLDRLESYQLPLVFFSTRFEPTHSSDLRSHLDFKDLLLYEAGARDRPHDANPFVMNVGPTGAGTLAVITQDDGLLLLRTRQSLTFILADKLPHTASTALETPASFLGAFREYRDHFDAFGHGGPSPSMAPDGDIALAK
jgi:hypothetical protein